MSRSSWFELESIAENSRSEVLSWMHGGYGWREGTLPSGGLSMSMSEPLGTMTHNGFVAAPCSPSHSLLYFSHVKLHAHLHL